MNESVKFKGEQKNWNERWQSGACMKTMNKSEER